MWTLIVINMGLLTFFDQFHDVDSLLVSSNLSGHDDLQRLLLDHFGLRLGRVELGSLGQGREGHRGLLQVVAAVRARVGKGLTGNVTGSGAAILESILQVVYGSVGQKLIQERVGVAISPRFLKINKTSLNTK